VVQVEAREMCSHFEDECRGGERGADPATPGHIDELGVRPGFVGRGERLKRHAADRTGAGTDLANLGMHRAGVDDPGQSRLGRRVVARRQILFRIGGELAPASARAEEIGATAVAVAVRGLVRIDLHAADRVEGGRGFGAVRGRSVFHFAWA